MSTAGTAARRDRFETVDGLELHYSEWGAGNDETVVCVHGFSRNGRDFDHLAAELAGDHGYRVLCPDVPGRGLSQWSDDPGTDYTSAGLAGYVAGFCEARCPDSFHWVGTSMGGAMGIRLAGGRLRDRIDRLVLNDIGPGAVDEDAGEETDEGRQRIYDYLSDPPTFDTYTELEAYYREIYDARDEEATDWTRFTLSSSRRTDDGGVTRDYDPEIVEVGFSEPRGSLWAEYESITADTLVLRGGESDILAAPTATAMTERGPGAELVEFPGVGHAPSLNVPGQVEPVVSFLRA
jgi:pimeloyl-ACP methyl ester carboxylesterase